MSIQWYPGHMTSARKKASETMEFVDVIEIEHRNAMPFQALAGGFGTGDGAAIAVLLPGERVDEEVGGGAGTHPHDTVVRDISDRRLGDCAFQIILRHCHFFSLHFSGAIIAGIAGIRKRSTAALALFKTPVCIYDSPAVGV